MFVCKHFLYGTRSGKVRLLIFRDVVAICNFFSITIYSSPYLRAFHFYCCAIWFLKALVLFSLFRTFELVYSLCFICSCLFFFISPTVFFVTPKVMTKRRCKRVKRVLERNELDPVFVWIFLFSLLLYLFYLFRIFFFKLLKLACILCRMISGKTFSIVRHQRIAYWNSVFECAHLLLLLL